MHVGDLDTILLTRNGADPVFAREGKIENNKNRAWISLFAARELAS
jgi:hypothetical protein